MEKGIDAGRRPELTGGGLIRSMGAWQKARELAGMGIRLKGDERILGNSDFVLDTLDASNERFDRKYQLKSQGVTLSGVSKGVSEVLGADPDCIYTPGKYSRNVKVRSLFVDKLVEECRILFFLGDHKNTLTYELWKNSLLS